MMKEYNEKLIEAFLTEYKVIDIVRITGLSKTTIYKYKNDPAFQAVLTERRSAMVSSAVDRMTQYMNENVEALQSVIRDPETSAQTKVNAIQSWTTTTDILRRLQALEDAEFDVFGRFKGGDDENIG